MTEGITTKIFHPLVSVCCMTYNHDKYIRDCIEGIMMQKTDFPIEVIIHDDASTDKTPGIVKEYADKYSDVLRPILQAKNKFSEGINPLFNILLPQAKGKYIALCEGDDYWTDPHKLQKQVNFLEENPDYVICYHDAIVIDNYDNIVSESKLKDDLKKDFSEEELIQGKMILTLTMCFRNILHEFPDEIYNVYNSDKFMTSLLGNHGKGKYMADIANAVYRKHSSAIWSSLDKIQQKYHNGVTRAWLYRYYKRIGQTKYADYFKGQVNIYFSTILKEIALTEKHQYDHLVECIINQYRDIIDESSENKLQEIWKNYQAMKKVRGKKDVLPHVQYQEFTEYKSCSYIEGAIAFYHNNMIYTCCYPDYIKDEGIIADLNDGKYSVNDMIKKKREIIEKRMRNEYGGCSVCPKLIKKNWRQNWDIRIGHVNLNHLLACNLKCVYCGYTEISKNYLPTNNETIINVIRILKEKGFMLPGAIFYIGNGEPSISNDMDELITEIMQNNNKVVVQSNGTKYKQIYTYGIKEKKLRLTLTPDAGKETTYEKMKGRKLFHVVWQNIKRYSSETNGNITVKIIMREENVDDVESIVDLCEESNVKNIVVDIDLNIRNNIEKNILSSVGRFVEYSKNKNIKIMPGVHWPKDVLEKYIWKY